MDWECLWGPVSPEEVFLLLSDLWERVSITQLSQLLRVALCQDVISGCTVTLKNRPKKEKKNTKIQLLQSQFKSENKIMFIARRQEDEMM